MANTATAENPTQFHQDQEEQFDNGYQGSQTSQRRANNQGRSRSYQPRSSVPDETVAEFRGEDGLKWVGIGGCAIGAGISMLAMGLCIHGLLSGNQASAVRQNNWR